MRGTIIRDCGTGIVIGALTWCVGFIRGSFIVGSKMAFFSGASMIAPLAGAYGGITALLSMHIIRVSLMCTPDSLLSWSHIALAYHIPTVCAGVYWAWIGSGKYYTWWSVRIGMALLPLCCMMLFSCDPIGSQAWQYTLFWLIPAASALIPHKHLLFHAYASTFIAHAVGSVLWVWTHTMPPTLWLGLIPVVMIERTAIALGMVCSMVCIERGICYLSRIYAFSHYIVSSLAS